MRGDHDVVLARQRRRERGHVRCAPPVSASVISSRTRGRAIAGLQQAERDQVLDGLVERAGAVGDEQLGARGGDRLRVGVVAVDAEARRRPR